VASTRELRLRAGAISIWTLGRLSYSLHGRLPRGSVDLAVTSLRPPMLVDGGFLNFAFGYTYYYSLTHMRAVGTLTIAGRRIPVHGLAWMDHQWGSSAGDAVRGWDWMALQLDDQTDLSLTNERTTAGVVRWAMALLPDGRQVFVPGALITPLGRWRSPTTGIVYPSGWRVRVPGLRLDVLVRPTVRDQEMADSLVVSGYRSSYWEGSGTVAGTRAGHRVTGKAYTELTGYGTPPPSLHLQP
jgi:predicted secreted hydrolase